MMRMVARKMFPALVSLSLLLNVSLIVWFMYNGHHGGSETARSGRGVGKGELLSCAGVLRYNNL